MPEIYDNQGNITYAFRPCRELEELDANCNNCLFMKRDIEKFAKWKQWHHDMEQKEFESSKEKALQDAKNIKDPREREGMLRVANKMRWEFRYVNPVSYGFCEKKQTDVSFIANVCQLETQECFVHRKSQQ